jgi:hypothetical protein
LPVAPRAAEADGRGYGRDGADILNIDRNDATSSLPRRSE